MSDFNIIEPFGELLEQIFISNLFHEWCLGTRIGQHCVDNDSDSLRILRKELQLFEKVKKVNIKNVRLFLWSRFDRPCANPLGQYNSSERDHSGVFGFTHGLIVIYFRLLLRRYIHIMKLIYFTFIFSSLSQFVV